MPLRESKSSDDTAVNEVHKPRELRRMLRPFVDALPTPTLLVDSNGTIVGANAAIEGLLGFDRRELDGESLETVLHDLSALEFALGSQGPRDHRPHIVGKCRVRHRDGSDLCVEVGLGSCGVERASAILVTLTDVSRQVQAERETLRLAADLRVRLRELGEAVRAKDLLLREIHHRVKNNLQIVSSLLSLQARRVNDAGARRLFEESRERLLSMSLIHEQLYQGSDLGRVDFGSYLKNLIAGIARGHVGPDRAVSIEVQSVDASLDIDAAVPLGLLVHELVSNALKHAFPNGGPGSIVVSLVTLPGGRYQLEVSDDGIGAGEPSLSTSTFGQRLIALLARQLDAECICSTELGTSVRLRFDATSSPGEST